jgi:hypothetical protein
MKRKAGALLTQYDRGKLRSGAPGRRLTSQCGENAMMYGYDMMSGPWALGHVAVFVVFAALMLYPIGRILQRLGFSPFWSVVALIPLANLVGLWIVAMAPWPRDGYGSRAASASNPTG